MKNLEFIGYVLGLRLPATEQEAIERIDTELRRCEASLEDDDNEALLRQERILLIDAYRLRKTAEDCLNHAITQTDQAAWNRAYHLTKEADIATHRALEKPFQRAVNYLLPLMLVIAATALMSNFLNVTHYSSFGIASICIASVLLPQIFSKQIVPLLVPHLTDSLITKAQQFEMIIDTTLLKIVEPTYREQLNTLSYQGEIPTDFIDPISLDIINDPITLSSGITYDRTTLSNYVHSPRSHLLWLGKSSFVCPVSKKEINQDELKFGTNILIKNQISQFVACVKLDELTKSIPTLETNQARAKKASLNISKSQALESNIRQDIQFSLFMKPPSETNHRKNRAQSVDSYHARTMTL